MMPSRFFQAVDVRDVRMVQRREDFRFALESRQPLGIAGHRRRQHLDGDAALQIGVGRPIDLAHAARADLGGDFIRTEAGADCEGHVGRTGVIIRGMRGFGGLLLVHGAVAFYPLRRRSNTLADKA